MRPISVNTPDIDASVGLAKVSQKLGNDLQLPLYESLTSSSINEPRSLDKIFLFENLESLFFKKSFPVFSDSNAFSPSTLPNLLSELKYSLRNTAQMDLSSARLVGRLFKIIDDEKQLLDLLKMYRHAIFQG